jgi:YidC/Oxa1 family membrane protein insertase
MKKNWTIFITICVATYAWMLFTQYQANQEFQQAQQKFKQQMAAFEAKQQEEADAAAAKKAAAVEALAKLQVLTPEGEPKDLPPAKTEEIRKLQQILFTVSTAPKHEVDTPLYRVVLSELGARPILWEIKSSRWVTNSRDGGDTATVHLIPQVAEPDGRAYPLGFVGNTARDFNDALFRVERSESPEGIRLKFTSEPLDGSDLVSVKEYLFRPDSYVVTVRAEFRNGPTTIKLLGGRQGFGLAWQGGFGNPEVVDRAHGFTSVVYALKDSIRSRTVDAEEKVDVEGPIQWVGQENKYFTALLLPKDLTATRRITAGLDRNNLSKEFQVKGTVPFDVEVLDEPVELAESQSVAVEYLVYAGPKAREALSTDLLNPGYDAAEVTLAEGVVDPAALVFHTMPLGMTFLRPVGLMLLGIMRFLHDLISSWGLAIILTTVTVRILIYPLTHWAIKAQARTMVEQQRIRPEMEAIQKRFKDDAMKRNAAIMELYREHKVNPLGMLRGCVPILLQAPIFMALYVVFEQSVELRGKSFLWISDLSNPDSLIYWGWQIPLIGPSFNLLPILMGVTNYLQMKIMRMPSTDELQEQIQKQMMIMMPIMFTFFLYQLPSGLVLYWVVSNTISIGQSILTKRIIAADMAKHGIPQPAR